MTSNELSTTNEQPQPPKPNAMLSKIEYSKTLAAASLLPRSYQQNPANVLLAIELGEALGIPTIQAITGIHVIEGKPSASSDLMVSLVRKAGHKVRVTANNEQSIVIAELIRSDDPEFTYRATWDLKRAQQAGLTNKDNWKKHPMQMLRARAVAEVCRMGATDALYGVNHEHSEIEVSQVSAPAARRVTAAEVLGEPEPAIQDAEVVEDEQFQLEEPTDWPEPTPVPS